MIQPKEWYIKELIKLNTVFDQEDIKDSSMISRTYIKEKIERIIDGIGIKIHPVLETYSAKHTGAFFRKHDDIDNVQPFDVQDSPGQDIRTDMQRAKAFPKYVDYLLDLLEEGKTTLSLSTHIPFVVLEHGSEKQRERAEELYKRVEQEDENDE